MAKECDTLLYQSKLGTVNKSPWRYIHMSITYMYIHIHTYIYIHHIYSYSYSYSKCVI